MKYCPVCGEPLKVYWAVFKTSSEPKLELGCKNKHVIEGAIEKYSSCPTISLDNVQYMRYSGAKSAR